ncbi:hypothetical protein F1721_04000 [Saccharopolyspora hirsuta]|uniref:Uncharacterized protein n=1 Tax=Saccharopolyspora hirsuta TaxID=1837 RepID=A0A5M7C9X3_SACHI|nr:hypothetical protein F1721_04000 [Saccharopolyspora hirsuta]
MFWLQVSTLVLVNVLIASMLLIRPPRVQHGGAGDGALNVWQLIEEVETERQQQAASGRTPEVVRCPIAPDLAGAGPPGGPGVAPPRARPTAPRWVRICAMWRWRRWVRTGGRTQRHRRRTQLASRLPRCT